MKTQTDRVKAEAREVSRTADGQIQWQITATLQPGIANGYFTRLVVTNYRLLILQGYEVCRSWSIHHLPRSLIRSA